ncbi:OPT/YSL family transporter [Lacticaseibacillus brantae]|uniref:OPT family oligopeptide transporter n=1 Tax=Lacticaseibacillus brantae DSM 23927 TaxID=1423727 RepID=A0A0R2B9Y1_9LACO|nr:OPT/YSL family transporter [Lacticaseibacillus brantae]KRM72982.1 OPT family oligopeptide transporter [Lacticaseibacillus brantae DSM 23927]
MEKQPTLVTPKVKAATGSTLVLIVGLLLAILFAASTAYSGMKAGLTVAAGIPGAIIGSTVVRAFARKQGFAGVNQMQGMASGGETVASGIIYVLPAVLLIGAQFNFLEAALVGILGLTFGVGVSAIVEQHLLINQAQVLIYPEAMAISETIRASAEGGTGLKMMGAGFGIGGLITLVTSSVFGWVNNHFVLFGDKGYRWKFELEVNPLLAGIGFIVGLDVAVKMFAGSLLANFAIVPLIGYFTDMAQSSAHVWNAAGTAVSSLDFDGIVSGYTKYLGAGMMLAGGIIGALKLVPIIVSSLKATLGSNQAKSKLGIGLLIFSSLGVLAVATGLSGNLWLGLLAGGLSLLLAFVFVVVAANLTGTLGTSNLPVSGMTIASLVLLTLLFVVMGWTDLANTRTLLLLATFVVTAISIGGGYSQTQKATVLMKADRAVMQRRFLLAAGVGTLTVIGVILLLKNQLVSDAAVPVFGLPQANLIATLTSGILTAQLPFNIIIIGIVMGIVMYFLKLPIMTVAIGFYLPMATTSIILVGALIRVLIEFKNDNAKTQVQNGVSLSSGLIAGGSIVGLIGILLSVSGLIQPGVPAGLLGTNTAAVLLLVFLVGAMVAVLCRKSVKN